MNDVDLKALGRLHTAREAKKALEIAFNTFDRVSFDLIYARQNQTLADWEAELTQALTYGARHMSVYQLTIEEGTAFGDRFAAGKLHHLPEEDVAADMFELTQDLMTNAGLPAYEVSNHAEEGQESRHNMIYWRGGDYLGIGPGAHGRLTLEGTRYTTDTPLAPAFWLGAVETKGSGENDAAQMSRDDIDTEYLMMSLRTTEGTDLSRLQMSRLNTITNKINMLTESGMLIRSGSSITVPPAKRILLNAILRELLT